MNNFYITEDGNNIILEQEGGISGYKTIKEEIVETLQTVRSLKVVYGKEEKVLGNFPAACVSGGDFAGEYLTVGSGGSNQETYQHFVRLYFRTDQTNDPDYEDVLEGVSDDVIRSLRSNITLNGSCDWSLPIAGTWGFTLEKETPCRYFELKEQSTIIVTR